MCCAGYARIASLFIAGYFALINRMYYTHATLYMYMYIYNVYEMCCNSAFAAVSFYTLSMGLDAVDGKVARYFNQTSSFGAQLDMLSDRYISVTIYIS